MKANILFQNNPIEFWGYVRLLSERLGYSKRGSQVLKAYTIEECESTLKQLNIKYNSDFLIKVLNYMNYRSDVLNNKVQLYLMNLEKARYEYEKLKKIYDEKNFTCCIPMNKQKSEKQNPAYFTAIINILAENELRKIAFENNLIYGKDIYFDDNPAKLSYVLNDERKVIFTLSRRFDGAYPGIDNPQAIWEIKEYYYTTTFGSRVSDGVYETLLDGFEINMIGNYNKYLNKDKQLRHFYFVDDKFTWWDKGKSYLCRIIDMLNMGLVDSVIFGSEVFTEWPKLIREVVYVNHIHPSIAYKDIDSNYTMK